MQLLTYKILACLAAAVCSLSCLSAAAQSTEPGDDLVVQARDAWRRHDAFQLATLRNQLVG